MINMEVIKLYREGNSINAIAKQLNSYPSKIYKILLTANEPLRSKSEAQSANLASGKVKHPTKGIKRSEKTKAKIGDKVYSRWQKASEEEKKRRSKMSKEQWKNMTPDHKRKIKERSIKQIHAASKKGSKMELALVTALNEKQVLAVHHKKKFLPNSKLEVDILLPELYTVIEIDGPSHFSPVWGEEALQKTQKADAEKNGLLLQLKYNVIRIRYSSKHFAKKHIRLVLDKLLPILKSLKDKKSQYNEIEVLC